MTRAFPRSSVTSMNTKPKIPDHYNPDCDCRSCREYRLEGKGGPFTMSEAELLALEERHDKMLADAKRVRYHLTECEKGDAKTLEAFDSILCYIGIFGDVVFTEPTQPTAEMAATTGD